MSTPATAETTFDTLVGAGMLGVATFVFVYYSAWTFLVPFINEDSVVAKLFPPREWAIWLPALLLVFGVAVVGTFVSFVMFKSAQKKKAKLEAKKSQ